MISPRVEDYDTQFRIDCHDLAGQPKLLRPGSVGWCRQLIGLLQSPQHVFHFGLEEVSHWRVFRDSVYIESRIDCPLIVRHLQPEPLMEVADHV